MQYLFTTYPESILNSETRPTTVHITPESILNSETTRQTTVHITPEMVKYTLPEDTTFEMRTYCRAVEAIYTCRDIVPLHIIGALFDFCVDVHVACERPAVLTIGNDLRVNIVGDTRVPVIPIGKCTRFQEVCLHMPHDVSFDITMIGINSPDTPEQFMWRHPGWPLCRVHSGSIGQAVLCDCSCMRDTTPSILCDACRKTEDRYYPTD
jgi:hypothetical protein